VVVEIHCTNILQQQQQQEERYLARSAAAVAVVVLALQKRSDFSFRLSGFLF